MAANEHNYNSTDSNMAEYSHIAAFAMHFAYILRGRGAFFSDNAC